MGQKLIKKIVFTLTVFCLNCACIQANEAAIEGEMFITFQKVTPETQKEAVLRKYQLKLVKYFELFGFGLYRMETGDTWKTIDSLKKEPFIKEVSPNHIEQAYGIINDPEYTAGNQWYLSEIKWEQALNELTNTNLVKVAVIDSGVSKIHNQLSGILIEEGEYDYSSNDNDASDEDGHGTAVAGIIGGRINDGAGIAGISPNVRILPLKSGDNTGGVRTLDSTISSIQQAILQEVRIINLSQGGASGSSHYEAAINECANRRILVVCAAGNQAKNNDTNPDYPSSYASDAIISVAASNKTNGLADSSNYGYISVDLAAPGVDILGCSVLRDSLYAWDFRTDEQGWNSTNTGQGIFKWGTYGENSGFWTTDGSGALGSYTSNTAPSLKSGVIDLSNANSARLEAYFYGWLGQGDFVGMATTDGTGGGLEAIGRTFETGGVDHFSSPFLVDISKYDGLSRKLKIDLISDADANLGWLLIGALRVSTLSSSAEASSFTKTVQGTSFSTPMVTGVAAMIMSQNTNLTALDVKNIILQSARKVSGLSNKVASGGILDAQAAMIAAKTYFSLSNCVLTLSEPFSLRYDGQAKDFAAFASPTNSNASDTILLGNIGNPTTGYGTISSLGPNDYRNVTVPGIDGVFRPHRNSTLISSTGLRFSFPTNLISADPGGDTAKPPWKKNADSTGGPTGGLTSYFTGLGINWSSNSLFAVPSAGITFDLNEIRPPGQDFTRFTTYFAMHSGEAQGDAAYAILVDGNLVKSGRNFTASTPYSGLIEADIPANARFLTLVVGDNGDDMHWDHGVFVNPTLYANIEIPLSIQYEGINSTVYGPTTNPPTNPGQYQLTMSDSTGRYSGTYTTNITILKADPIISNVPTASPIAFGQTLSNSVLSNGLASVPGGWAWENLTDTPSVGTTNRYSVVFTPSNTATHTSVTTNIGLTVNKAAPIITWVNPAPITFGTALSTNTQLNASANAAGNFRFTPTNGAVLNPGTHTLTAVFTASNTNNYLSPRTNTVSLTVNKATPGISNLPSASAITFGQALSNSVLSGGSNGLAGRWAWVTPSNRPGVGTNSFNVTFLPVASNNFNSVTTNVSLVVSQATPRITRIPAASAITFGQALSNSILSNGVASVPGNWSWEIPATAPNAGTKGRFPIVFTPSNTTTHRPVITNVPLVVNRARQTITFTLPTTNAFTSNGLIPLNGTSSSGLSVAYRSRSTKILQISGTNAVMKGRGTTTITASQAGNSNYLAASNVVRTIVIQ